MILPDVCLVKYTASLMDTYNKYFLGYFKENNILLSLCAKMNKKHTDDVEKKDIEVLERVQ